MDDIRRAQRRAKRMGHSLRKRRGIYGLWSDYGCMIVWIGTWSELQSELERMEYTGMNAAQRIVL
jgi:hypothetical protein